MEKEKRNFIIKFGLLYEGLFTGFFFAVFLSSLKIHVPKMDDFIRSVVICVPLCLLFGIIKAAREYKKYQETRIMPKTDYKWGMTLLIVFSSAILISRLLQ